MNRTSEQKENSNSSNAGEAAAKLRSSITNVKTLPKEVYKGYDALKMQENLKKGENKTE